MTGAMTPATSSVNVPPAGRYDLVQDHDHDAIERARLLARVPASEAEWRRIDERLAELGARR